MSICENFDCKLRDVCYADLNLIPKGCPKNQLQGEQKEPTLPGIDYGLTSMGTEGPRASLLRQRILLRRP